MQRKKLFILCGQVIKGSWSPSASLPSTKEQSNSYFRFVSNSLRPWGGSPVREAFVRALMSGSSSTGLSRQLAPISAREPAQRMFLRQREARDNGNNAGLPGACLWASAPLLVRGEVPWGTARGHGGAPSLVEPTGHLTGPVSLRRLPGTGALVPDSSVLLLLHRHHVMGSLGVIQLRKHPSSEPLELCGFRPQVPHL